jgi:hypothetical protein
MVAIDNEVGLTQLDCHDWREGALGEGFLERAHPVAAEGVQRAKVAGEGAGAPVRSDEGVERYLTDTEIAAPERLQSFLDLDQLEQTFAAASP